MSNRNGFTLIEILVVIAILSIVLVAFSSTLFSILNGEAKTEVSNQVKQNGEYVLSFIDQTIRNARNIAVSGGGSVLTAVNPDGNSSTTTISCVTGNPNKFTLTSTGVPPINSQPITEDFVTVLDCTNVFTPLPSNNNNPPGVQVKFQLQQTGILGKAIQQSSQTFRTTVFIRVYK